jgi:hypothetical protein
MWALTEMAARNVAREAWLRKQKAERLRLQERLRQQRCREYLAHKLSLGCTATTD